MVGNSAVVVRICQLIQDNNLERAADWVFSHAGDLDAMETDQQAAEGEGSTTYHNGPGSKDQLLVL